jgi:hypothetical protein
VKRVISLHSRRVHKTLTLWLGLAALMVQGLAPLCTGGPMDGTARGIASIVICTAHGFETVQIDAGGTPPAKHALDCCTVCHVPNGFTSPPPIFAAVPFGVAYERARLVATPVITPSFYSSYVSRAPPAATSHEIA